MKRYETIFILDPDLSDEDRSVLFERFTDLIPKHDGLLIVLDEWGLKKLAYEIKKKAKGYYVRLEYCGTGTLVDELERFFRIDDRVLKFMTILLDNYVDVERIQEEIAAAKTEVDQHDEGEPDQEDQHDTDPNTHGETESETTETETVETENKIEG
jgi:small subunit ribosomal protein S6